MRWEIGVLTLGDGRLEPFELLNLYWTTSTPWGGDWVDVVTLGDYVCCCKGLVVTFLCLGTQRVSCFFWSSGGWYSDGWEGFSKGES